MPIADFPSALMDLQRPRAGRVDDQAIDLIGIAELPELDLLLEFGRPILLEELDERIEQ